jgi:hypothetical protein
MMLARFSPPRSNLTKEVAVAVERCNQCGRAVDLDWHVEQIEYQPDGTAICVWCLEDKEDDDAIHE